MVYRYASQHCDKDDVPDSFARAFRNASGQVVLIDSSSESRRAVGPSLDSVAHRCPLIYNSHLHPEFDQFTYKEWLVAPFTPDGSTVYSLVHNEWYPSARYSQCARDAAGGWINSITMAVSHDGGASFALPADYVVLQPPIDWSSSFRCAGPNNTSNSTIYGDFGSSNIIERQGYYYSYYTYRPPPGGPGRLGECVMRTRNIADASSWEVWTGSGFLKSRRAVCEPLLRLGGHASVSFNTYLGLYVMSWNNAKGAFFQTSSDLLSWSQPFMFEGSNTAAFLFFQFSRPNGGPNVFMAYPSLLDPTDTSRNFSNTGQSPYLYYTINHNGIDRDLYRVQVQFRN